MSHLLLIHGAWGGSWVFEETLANLRAQGHSASAIDLTGHGNHPAPTSEVTMQRYVQDVVDAIESMEGPVILAGHSLGGAIISEVAERIPERIERLVYIAAMLPQAGQSPIELMQSDEDGALLARLEFSEDESVATVGPNTVKEVLLNDIRDAQRRAKFVPHFDMKQATQPFFHKATVSKEAFGTVPKTYIRASQDKALSPALQERMIAGWEVQQVVTMDSGHYPMLSLQPELAEVLSQVAGTPVA